MIEMIKYILCTAAGVGIGYYVAKRQLENHYFSMLAHETDEARDFYRRKYMKKAAEEGENSELTEAAIKAAESLRQYSGVSVGPSILTQELEATIARDSTRGEHDIADENSEESKEHVEEVTAEKVLQGTEKAADELDKLKEKPEVPKPLIREPKKPQVNYNKISTPEKVEESENQTDDPPPRIRIITKDDFVENESGFKQISFTYYAGDDVLANESDEIVDGEARTLSLGVAALKKLKAGGIDALYVQNLTGGWEFDIAWVSGNYSDEILSS